MAKLIDQNVYNNMQSILNAKGGYETVKANGGTNYNQYHTNAQGNYQALYDAGYGDIADAFKSSNYAQALDIFNQYAPQSSYTYQDQYSELMQTMSNQLMNYQPFTYDKVAPEYNNRYDATINQLLNGINNYASFSYDPETDPLYSSYKKQYTREGKRATEDAIGAASAASGGIPSSYAVTAATQAGDYYAAQMADKVPELYQIAYNKYLQDFSMELQKLSATQGQEQYDYAKYLDQLSQFNTDRNFAYNTWSDGYNQLANNLSTVASMSETEYSRYLNQLQQEQNANDRAWQEAQYKAQYGDYSGLNSLGVDTSNYDPNAMDFSDKLSLAKTLASLGDYSLLEELTGRTINVTNTGTGGSSDGGGGDDTPKKLTYDEIAQDAIEAILDDQFTSYNQFLTALDAICKANGIAIGSSDYKKIIDALKTRAGDEYGKDIAKWIKGVNQSSVKGTVNHTTQSKNIGGQTIYGLKDKSTNTTA